MFATVSSISLFGLHGIPVGVEADIQHGLPAFEIVGLPASAIREAKERVRSAILNSGYEWPRSRITVSLTPADFRKEGSGLDLPIAVAILAASEQIYPVSSDTILLGELTLDGSVRTFRGFFAAISHALDAKSLRILTPHTELELEILSHSSVCPIANLTEALTVLANPHSTRQVSDVPKNQLIPKRPAHSSPSSSPAKTFDDVQGHESVKRALEIAAVGHHHILLYGAPGVGKTMLAERLVSILPLLTSAEKAEINKIYSVAGIPLYEPDERPFRAPHHTISTSGLLGGGTIPRPGEVSLAHHGVLFLDELPEFSRSSIEGLRQPLSNGTITISRSLDTYSFPSDFQLVAAMNPCPCGYYGSEHHTCSCSLQSIEHYQKKISGPILDRIDLSVWVDGVSWPTLLESPSQNYGTSEKIRQSVINAKEFMRHRQATDLHNKEQLAIPFRTDVNNDVKTVFIKFAENQHLSMRGASKLTRIARTIADIESSLLITKDHLFEALQFRSLQSAHSKRR